MHLTTEEVALASTAIGGIIGFLGGGIRDRSSEHREHLKRLWEKEAETYEELLMESGARKDQYARARSVVRDIADIRRAWKELVKNPYFDELASRRLTARLIEFGSPEVREAHGKCGRQHIEFLSYIFMIGGIEPAMEKATIEEVTAVLDAADKVELALAEAVTDTIRTLPTAGRKISPGVTVKKRLTLFR